MIKPFESIAIFLERRKTRQYVGTLRYLKDLGVFEFEYDEDYLYSKNIISLGPEFPLTQRVFRSKKLFPSLQDRIPLRENAAYPDYCKAMGIDVKETNPIILLGTIGKRGPSSFIFEPCYEQQFSSEDLKKFRKELGLTTREFAHCFNLSQAALIRIENGLSSGNELLKRIEIYVRFPETAIYEIELHGGFLRSEKKRDVIKILLEKKNLAKGP